MLEAGGREGSKGATEGGAPTRTLVATDDGDESGDFKCIHDEWFSKCDHPDHRPDPTFQALGKTVALARLMPYADDEIGPPREQVKNHEHDEADPACDCIKCSIKRLRTRAQAHALTNDLIRIAHDLDENCDCPTCSEVNEIRKRYTDGVQREEDPGG